MQLEPQSLVSVPHPMKERPSAHELIWAQAARSPERVALRWRGGFMRYGTLVATAERVCGTLITHQMKPGDRVAILSGRTPEWAALLLGTLAAGASFIPLAPHNPIGYTQSILDAAQPSLIIVDDDVASSVPTHINVPILTRSSAFAGPAKPPVPGDTSRIAYVIFTSGSTGRPKGVMVSHRNLTRLMVEPTYSGLDETSVGLALSPPAFDASIFDLWPFLAQGGSVALHPDEQPTSESIARCIVEHGVTTLFITTGLFHRIASDAPEILAGVTVLTGGERGSADDARRVLSAGARAILHCYGPTEATVFTSLARYPRGADIPDIFPIGRPLPGTSCYVLDATREPVPFGRDGELYIGGEAVAQGYLADSKLTDEKFVADPFVPGATMYRTGDRVRMDEMGQLIFIDRLDDEVKIRGHRIAPGAIASAIEANADIRHAVVLARSFGPADQRLVAYLESSTNEQALVAALRADLAEKFPSAMVPSHFVVMDKLPLAPNGKVDRAALPLPYSDAKATPMQWDNPREEWVANIMADILGIAPESATDDFFSLGGDSLLAMKLIQRIRTETGIQLPLRDIFADATVRALAYRLPAENSAFEEGVL